MKLQVKYKISFTLIFIILSPFSTPQDDEELYNSVVGSVGFLTDESGAAASGFFINENTFITNHHVTSELDVESASIEMKNGKTFDVRQIIKEYRTIDLAVILIDSYTSNTIWLEKEDLPEKNDEVYSIGNPTDNKMRVDYFKMTKGRIRKIEQDEWFYDRESEDVHNALVVQHTAIIKPGNSGGPLLNSKGKVIGVNTFFYDDSLNYAVHVNELIKILKKNGIEYNEKVTKSDTRKKKNDWTFKKKVEYVIGMHEYYFEKYFVIIISGIMLYCMAVVFGCLTMMTYLIIKRN